MISGVVRLDERIVAEGKKLAITDYAQCEAKDFSGEEVRDLGAPEWMGDAQQLMPLLALNEVGLKIREPRSVHLYGTCGIDEHIDNMDGLSVAVVLHSDGFTFVQCGKRKTLKTGDWFVFDDSVAHEVKESRKATTLLVLTAAIDRV